MHIAWAISLVRNSFPFHSRIGLIGLTGPQIFRPQDAPRYKPAEITIVVCWFVSVADLIFIWWYCRHQNKKKAAVRADPKYRKVENQEWLDLTDRENPEFVYTL